MCCFENAKRIFVSLFFFSYKKGGVASGMRHTETNTYDIQRLLHVKGKRRVTAMEVQQERLNLHSHSGKAKPTDSRVF